jgi:hypothetical protein
MRKVVGKQLMNDDDRLVLARTACAFFGSSSPEVKEFIEEACGLVMNRDRAI